jgi:hypothetical protein
VKPRIRKTRGYTVGITTFVNCDGTFGLWENGLRQNVIFLYEMFQTTPNCARVLLLNHGNGEPTDMGESLDIPLSDVVRTPTVIDDLDYVISIGAAMEVVTLAILREKGTKFVTA